MRPCNARQYIVALLITCVFAFSATAQDARFGKTDFEIKLPALIVAGADVQGRITYTGNHDLRRAEVPAMINGERTVLHFSDGEASFHVQFDRREPFSLKIGGFAYVEKINPMPGWWSVVPPLLVILLALVFKEVYSSLLTGVVAGACLIAWYSADTWLISGFYAALTAYILPALADKDHASIVIFSLLIAAMVVVISRSGGMAAVITQLSKRARNSKSGQLVAWLLGVAIFFDDYANTLVVGNTMQPLARKLHISKEKLAYLVDSTAAPVASIAFITTWIGAELGYIQDALDTLNASSAALVEALPQSAYAVFIGSLNYAFYPVFTLVFMLFLIAMARDFGPMWRAEILARKGEELSPQRSLVSDELSLFEAEEDIPHRAINALLPIAVMILGVLVGLLITGYSPEVWSSGDYGLVRKLSLTIGQANSYAALLCAAFTSLIVAIALPVAQGIFSFNRGVELTLEGFKTMIPAMTILVLAWALSHLTSEMQTAEYIAGLSASHVEAWMVPAVTFVLASVVAFATGSSWGTMAIVYPIMLPLVWELGIEAGLSGWLTVQLFFNVAASVLAGAVLGDHCSPISDTTILSSMATGCNHLAHVRTQLPYALTCGALSFLAILWSSIFPAWWWLGYGMGIVLLAGAVRFLGKKVPLSSDRQTFSEQA